MFNVEIPFFASRGDPFADPIHARFVVRAAINVDQGGEIINKILLVRGEER